MKSTLTYIRRKEGFTHKGRLVAFQNIISTCEELGKYQGDDLDKEKMGVSGFIIREKISFPDIEEISDNEGTFAASGQCSFPEKTACVSTSISDFVEANNKPALKSDTIQMSIFFVKNLDALAVLLMLMKHGTVGLEFLHTEISEDNSLELIAELRRYELVIINGSKISLSDKGINVIEKLQRKSA